MRPVPKPPSWCAASPLTGAAHRPCRSAPSGLCVSAAATMSAETRTPLQRDAGVSHFEYQVMAMLPMSPERTRRMREVAASANGSLTRLSRTVDRLEALGGVIRRPDPEDGRSTLAVLTDAGWHKVGATAPGHVSEVRRWVFDPLSSTQVRHLREIATRIREVVRPDDLSPPMPATESRCYRRRLLAQTPAHRRPAQLGRCRTSAGPSCGHGSGRRTGSALLLTGKAGPTATTELVDSGRDEESPARKAADRERHLWPSLAAGSGPRREPLRPTGRGPRPWPARGPRPGCRSPAAGGAPVVGPARGRRRQGAQQASAPSGVSAASVARTFTGPARASQHSE